MAAESIRGSAELSGSSGVSGVLRGDSRSRTQRGRLMGSRGMVRKGARVSPPMEESRGNVQRP